MRILKDESVVLTVLEVLKNSKGLLSLKVVNESLLEKKIDGFYDVVLNSPYIGVLKPFYLQKAVENGNVVLTNGAFVGGEFVLAEGCLITQKYLNKWGRVDKVINPLMYQVLYKTVIHGRKALVMCNNECDLTVLDYTDTMHPMMRIKQVSNFRCHYTKDSRQDVILRRKVGRIREVMR